MVSFNWRRASEAMVSKTIDDLPDPDTPVKIVILRFGIRNDTFLRLFSRAPRIAINSWDTLRSFSNFRQRRHRSSLSVQTFDGHPHPIITRQERHVIMSSAASG